MVRIIVYNCNSFDAAGASVNSSGKRSLKSIDLLIYSDYLVENSATLFRPTCKILINLEVIHCFLILQ